MFSIMGTAQGGDFLKDYTNDAKGIVLTAGFVPDASHIMVGEPLFLTFVVSNRAEAAFQFSHVRNEIFTITATNTDGAAVNNRYFGLDGNGFERQEKVLPGKPFTSRIFVNERCVFDRAGDYTVTCTCDFGHFANRSNALARPIISVFKLTVTPSDPKRVGDIIEAWGRVAKTNGPLNEAALAMGEINDTRTIPPLGELVARNPSDYIAVRGLARFTNSAVADALVVVLKQGEDYTAGLAGSALRKSGQNHRIAKGLLPLLSDADPASRMQGARAVSWTGSELAFSPLRALLQDPSNEARYAAAEDIGRLGDERAFGVLTNCLSDPDFALRIAAVKGLRALGRPLQAEWVKPMIVQGRENVRSYYEAMDLLRMYGGDQAAPGLASCVHFDDPSVRNSYNMRLILAIEASPNGPKHYYQWHHDPNRDGTEQELAENRRILSELKAWLEKAKPDSLRPDSRLK